MLTEQQRWFIKNLQAASRSLTGWEPVDFLGKGSFGGVYLLKRGNVRCAAKIMRVTNEMMERYTAELQALERLRGERHAVYIYRWETVGILSGGVPETYLVILMEKLNKLPEKMSEQQVVTMAMQLCSLLEKCHSGTPKLYHRDIKPDNILVSDNGTYKLTDFGEAKITEMTHNMTGHRGTPLYMSPEMNSYSGYDGRSDLYSLGVTMYALLDGAAPFVRESATLEEAIHMRYSGRALPDIPGVSAGMMAVLRRLCAIRPDDRFSTARELWEELNRLSGTRSGTSANTAAASASSAYAKTSSAPSGQGRSGAAGRDAQPKPSAKVAYDADAAAILEESGGSQKYIRKRGISPKTAAFAMLDIVLLAAAAAAVVFIIRSFTNFTASTDQAAVTAALSEDEPRITYIHAPRGGYTVSGISDSHQQKIVIPAEYDSEPVERIGNEAFQNCMVGSVTIPDSIKSIGSRAFESCYDLGSVDIPDSVASIGKECFRNCRRLSSVRLPRGIESIEDGTFDGCDSLGKIVIPDGVVSIGDNAFSGCFSLTSISIPDSVVSIGDNAFSVCSSMTSISIPDSVASIGDNAFSGCEALTSISIPGSVENIPKRAFYCCSGLTEVTIEPGIKSIGHDAFAECTGLASVTIPDTVTELGGQVFCNCTGLTSVTIMGSGQTIGAGLFRNVMGVTVHCEEDSPIWEYCEKNSVAHDSEMP